MKVRVAIAACSAVLMFSAGTAWGQAPGRGERGDGRPTISAAAAAGRSPDPIPPLVDGVFWPLTLEEAIAESKRRRRLLLVVPTTQQRPSLMSQNAQYMMLSRTFKSPTLQMYLRSKAVVVRVSEQETPREFAAVIDTIRQRDRDSARLIWPVIAVYRDGKLVRLLPDDRFQKWGDDVDWEKYYIKSTGILLWVDQYYEALKSLEPAWSMLHERLNPFLEVPPMPQGLSAIPSDVALAVDDEAGPGEAGDPMSRLEAARAAVRGGNLFDATGLYTWLWERGAEIDPAFAPVRASLVIDEWMGLAMAREGSQERLEQLHAAYRERLPWSVYSDVYEWAKLCQALGRHGEVVEYLDARVNEEFEATILPASQRAVFGLIARSMGWSVWTQLPADPLEDLRRAARYMGKAPRSVPEREWESVRVFARRWLIDEACRRYAAALKRGGGRADEVAEFLLSVENSALARRSLVMTARAAGLMEKNARHELWLSEAASMPESVGMGASDEGE